MWRRGKLALSPRVMAPQRANCNHMEVRPSALGPGSVKDLLNRDSRKEAGGICKVPGGETHDLRLLECMCLSTATMHLVSTYYTPRTVPRPF